MDNTEWHHYDYQDAVIMCSMSTIIVFPLEFLTGMQRIQKVMYHISAYEYIGYQTDTTN